MARFRCVIFKPMILGAIFGPLAGVFFGDDLMAMRFACVLFQCLGVFAGLLTARRLCPRPFFLVGFCILLCVWMHPRYKVFEQSVALMAIYAGVLLLERPTRQRHFGVGIFGGLSAFIGCNHGAYHLAAFLLVIAFAGAGVAWGARARLVAAWVLGILVGYLPQLAMFLWAPGYFSAFVEGLRGIVQNGTNLAAPVPWPWRIASDAPVWIKIAAVAEGSFYVAFPLYFMAAATWCVRVGYVRFLTKPVLIAAIAVTIPYTHYVFSRPDLTHLGHGVPSLIIAGLALLAVPLSENRWAQAIFLSFLLIASVLANLFQIGITLRALSRPGDFIPVSVGGRRMWVSDRGARLLLGAKRLSERLVEPGESVFFGPHYPGLYAFTNRKSPTHQIYFIFPATPAEDRDAVEQLRAANVRWALLRNYALDGRKELRFQHTNPAVMSYFINNFGRIESPFLPVDIVFLSHNDAAL